MAKPVLFAIDDDPEVLRAVDRDLRREYGEHYRVMRANSGPQRARGAASSSRCATTPVALFLVDQRMPQMTGVEFLEQAIPLFPAAKRVLLTAYADTDAAIRAINTARIDYYLMKPWDPPEQRLYPVLDDLLADWQAGFRPPFEGVRVIGHRWSPDAFQIRDFLARNQVPYHWLDVESERRGRRQLLARRTPPMTAPRWSCSPTAPASPNPLASELAEKIGLQHAGGEAVLRPGDRRRRARRGWRRRSTAPPRGCAR